MRGFTVKINRNIAAVPGRASTANHITLLRVALLTVLTFAPSIAGHAQVAQAPIQGQNPQFLTEQPASKVKLGPVDWIFLIDASASMSGSGPGAANIFPHVQETLRRFVSEIQDGDSLMLYVFDATSRLVLKVQIRGDSDRNQVGPVIDDLIAKGAWTHTGEALAKALNEVYSRQDNKRPAAIILLTDGHEDVRGIKNPTRIPDAVKLISDEYVPYVFYVSLGTTADPELLRAVDLINRKKPGRGQVVDDPGAKDLPDEIRRIREDVKPILPDIKINRNTLDLGRIRPGGQGGPYSFDISSDKAATVRLMLMNVPAGHYIEGLPDTVDVSQERVQQVTFNVRVSDDATEGVQNYTLRVVLLPEPDPNPKEVPITLDVHTSSFEQVVHALKSSVGWVIDHLLWILLILALILLALYFFRQWYFEDRYPWEIIIRLLGGDKPSPAILHTPEGNIALSSAILTLGDGASKLPSSPATIEIQREGADHILKVLKGIITFTDPLGSDEHLKAGDIRKLKHNDCLMMPGYHSLLRYLNSSRKH
jgi:hypothetical protein